MNIDEARAQWLKTPRGESLIYHMGYLASDEELSADIRVLGAWARGLQADGKAMLFQKRLGVGVYEYRALKTSKGPVISAWLKRSARRPAGGGATG
jgi:uncharacterized protein YjlB